MRSVPGFEEKPTTPAVTPGISIVVGKIKDRGASLSLSFDEHDPPGAVTSDLSKRLKRSAKTVQPVAAFVDLWGLGKNQAIRNRRVGSQLLCGFAAEFQVGLTLAVCGKHENLLVVQEHLVRRAIEKLFQFEFQFLVFDLTALLRNVDFRRTHT